MNKHLWLLNRVLIKQKECLIWPFAKRPDGYGCLKIRRIDHLAHRIMCELRYGPAPIDKPNALHKCNNKICVNPGHLYWGSNSDNIADSVKAGTYRRHAFFA